MIPLTELDNFSFLCTGADLITNGLCSVSTVELAHECPDGLILLRVCLPRVGRPHLAAGGELKWSQEKRDICKEACDELLLKRWMTAPPFSVFHTARRHCVEPSARM